MEDNLQIATPTVLETVYGDMPIEGMDYTRYVGSSSSWVVRHELTYGDIMVSTLLLVLIVLVVTMYLHKLIGGGNRQ